MGKGYPWAHSKELQLRNDVIDYTQEYRGPTQGKRKFECKKLKGLHIFDLKEDVKFTWSKGGYRIYICTGCQKNKWISY